MGNILMILGVGGFAGVLTGLMGASGVMAVVPGMILLHYSAHQAVGVSLAVDMVASLVVSWTYLRNGRVNLRHGIWIAAAAIVGAQIGSRYATYVPEIGVSAVFGLLLLLSAGLFWRNHGNNELVTKARSTFFARIMNGHPNAAGLIIGLYAGICSGLFGAGGGSLFLVCLLLLGYSLHQAVGTSTLIMALTTASGTVGHAITGQLPYMAVGGVAAGTLMGSYASARLANQVSEGRLYQVIALVLGFLGIVVLVSPLVFS